MEVAHSWPRQGRTGIAAATDSPFARAKHWLVQEALPLWSTVGREANGGFHEGLDLTGAPRLEAPRRAMVQARQIAVFCLAHERGWSDASTIVADALAHLELTYYRPDGRPGWAFSADGEGRIVDDRRDTYSHAFVLFALAWTHRVFGGERLLDLADETLEAMDALMACPHGGYRDSAGDPGERLRQNPHMHLFEALVELAHTGGRERYGDRMDAIHDLFVERILQENSELVCEEFDGRWRPPPLTWMRWEPGHHFEWDWLLRRYAKVARLLVGGVPSLLYSRAMARGFDDDGLVIDALAGDGRVVGSGRRCWPQCEALKSFAVEHKVGRRNCRTRSEALLERMFDRFLTGPVAGGWIEHIDAQGRPLRQDIPASTLYHLAFAIAEVDRVFGEG